MRLIRLEFYRAFCSKKFLVALLVALLVSICHIIFFVIPESFDQQMYLDTVRFPLSVFNRWIGGWPGSLFPALYFTLIPLLVCIPFSNSLYTDISTGFVGQISSRSTLRMYYMAKFCATFATGAIVAVLPLVLNFYLTALFLPIVSPDSSSGLFPIFSYSMWGDLYYSKPFAYIARFMGLIATTSGLLACLPLLLTRLLSNKTIVLCSTFFICTIANFLFGRTDLKFLVPTIFMRPDQPVWGLDFTLILSTLIILVVFETLSLVISWRKHEVY